MPYLIEGIIYDNNALGGAPDHQHNDVFVPLKGIVETLGGEVAFIGATATVTLKGVVAHLTKSQPQVQLNQGSNTTDINLSSGPDGEGGDMYVPLGFFNMAYSLPVNYNDATKTISIG